MEDRRAFPSLTRALCALGGMFAGLSALSVAGSLCLAPLRARGIETRAFSYLLSGAAEMICVGLPAVLWARRGEARAAGAVRRDALGAARAVWIIAAALASVPVMDGLSALWSALLGRLGAGLGAGMAVPQSLTEAVICLLCTAVIAPVCEEEFFRGRLFAALETLGTAKALGLSALLFALMHGQPGAFPAQLCVGLILGVLLVRCRSVYAAMLFHAVYNGGVVLGALGGWSAAAVAPAAQALLLCAGAACLAKACGRGERVYTLPKGAAMNETQRALTAALIAVFLLNMGIGMLA